MTASEISKLKIIKNNSRSALSEKPITGLALLSIKDERAQTKKSDTLIDVFFRKKEKKIVDQFVFYNSVIYFIIQLFIMFCELNFYCVV